MTDKLRAAAQAALSAMDYMLRNGEWYCAEERANALRAALAESAIKESLTVAEPVAWLQITRYGNRLLSFTEPPKTEPPSYCGKLTPDPKNYPLYLEPQKEWVGLTGPEVDEAYRSVSDREWAIGGLTDARVFFCAIEAKLREKNGG
jgi:hypothetical protein